MDQKPSKKAGNPSKISALPIAQMDHILLEIITALLSNPMIYPANGELGVIKMANRMRQEIVDEGLAL